jgi:hypothetical protein
VEQGSDGEGAAMLRRVTDYGLAYHPPDRTLFGRVRVPGHAVLMIKREHYHFAPGLDSQAEYDRLWNHTFTEPLLVRPEPLVRHATTYTKGRNYWLFRGGCFWESEGLDQAAVKALLLVREDRTQRQVHRAKAYLRDVKDSQPPRRTAIPADVKRLVWDRDGGRCVRCSSTRDLQFDHVIPVVLGGGNEPANLQVLCAPCNQLKRDSVG